MSPRDRILIDAPRSEAVAALREVAVAVGLDWPPLDLGLLLVRLDGEIEGREDFLPRQGARRARVAWWHDYAGRRHLRVWAGPPDAADDRRPTSALASVYPERTLVLWRPGRTADVAVLCACGAWGDVWSLGWMGDRCGPCHDRRDAPGGAPLAAPLAAGGISCVAVSPGGRFVAVHRGGELNVWGAAEGRSRFGIPTVGTPLALGVAPTGRFVALALLRDEGVGVSAWDTATGRQIFVQTIGTAEEVSLAVSDAALFVLHWGRVSSCDLPPRGELLRLTDEEPAEDPVLSLDGSRLALLEAWGNLRLIAADYSLISRPVMPDWSYRTAAFTPAGECVVAWGSNMDGDLGLAWVAEVVPEDPDARLAWPGRREITDLGFSPKGPCVAACDEAGAMRVWRVTRGTGDSPVVADATDVTRCGWLADGRLLTHHTRGGVVNLWPADLFRDEEAT